MFDMDRGGGYGEGAAAHLLEIVPMNNPDFGHWAYID